MTDKASHYSENKSGVDQIPPELLLEWGDVFTYGAKKYGRDNWRKGTDWHEFYGSALRHLLRWWAGEDIDPESGLSHLAHALWNVGALRYYQIKGMGTDDRSAARIIGWVWEANSATGNPASVKQAGALDEPRRTA
jgi:hypothetical protein